MCGLDYFWTVGFKARSDSASRYRNDLAALLAGSEALVVKETLASLGDRVVSVIAHDETLFMQQGIALGAVPVEPVDFAFTPLALGNEREGVGRKTRGIGRPRRSVERGGGNAVD